ncbi:hypothetical protein AMATHDRAFT_7543 [Amanita thiersii Skay4041]|uniref:Uncharacterized protein n=1 Tax=Amanita thiersii Skay4041 TaxID=703135 RepID=A0A2A9N7V6_9AGAR|nr:hypothetical protein AMATHDRAFT_7543 [Amanita thiersii Skay4041]
MSRMYTPRLFADLLNPSSMRLFLAETYDKGCFCQDEKRGALTPPANLLSPDAIIGVYGVWSGAILLTRSEDSSLAY